MICIYQYHKEIKDGMIYICSEEVSVCPVCQSVLHVIGSRKRKAIEADGTKQTYILI